MPDIVSNGKVFSPNAASEKPSKEASETSPSPQPSSVSASGKSSDKPSATSPSPKSSGTSESADEYGRCPFDSAASQAHYSTVPKRDLRDRLKIALGLAKPTSPVISYSHRVEGIVRSRTYMTCTKLLDALWLTFEVDEYHGYGKVAAFEDCDANFLILRKFGWLRNYALLCIQDELAALERSVEALHARMREEDEHSLISKRRADIKFKENKELKEKIVAKLAQYGMLGVEFLHGQLNSD